MLETFDFGLKFGSYSLANIDKTHQRRSVSPTLRINKILGRRLSVSIKPWVADSPYQHNPEPPPLHINKTWDAGSPYQQNTDSLTLRINKILRRRLSESTNPWVADSPMKNMGSRWLPLPTFRTVCFPNGQQSSGFKGAQAWDIRSLGFSWFLHNKVFMGRRFLGKNTNLLF